MAASATIRKWSKWETIFKVGEGHTSELDTYHSYAFRKPQWVLENRFEVKTWKFLTRIWVWHRPLSTICYHYWVFFRTATFEMFHWQEFGVEKYAYNKFRVSTTILNPVDRWCKLKFGLLQDQVKLRHFLKE